MSSYQRKKIENRLRVIDQIGDGSCFFHSILYAIDEDYRSLKSSSDKKDYARNFRKLLYKFLLKKNNDTVQERNKFLNYMILDLIDRYLNAELSYFPIVSDEELEMLLSSDSFVREETEIAISERIYSLENDEMFFLEKTPSQLMRIPTEDVIRNLKKRKNVYIGHENQYTNERRLLVEQLIIDYRKTKDDSFIKDYLSDYWIFIEEDSDGYYQKYNNDIVEDFFSETDPRYTFENINIIRGQKYSDELYQFDLNILSNYYLLENIIDNSISTVNEERTALELHPLLLESLKNEFYDKNYYASFGDLINVTSQILNVGILVLQEDLKSIYPQVIYPKSHYDFKKSIYVILQWYGRNHFNLVAIKEDDGSKSMIFEESDSRLRELGFKLNHF